MAFRTAAHACALRDGVGLLVVAPFTERGVPLAPAGADRSTCRRCRRRSNRVFHATRFALTHLATRSSRHGVLPDVWRHPAAVVVGRGAKAASEPEVMDYARSSIATHLLFP